MNRRGDNRDLEDVPALSRNGEAHAVEADRALLEDILRQLGRRLAAQPRVVSRTAAVLFQQQGEAVDVGLCYGWISGQRRPLDEVWFLQKYVPRRRRSLWSQVNVAKVQALTVAGRMRPGGLAEVEAAKADGRWAAAYAGQRTADVPADLAAALDSNPAAARAFAALGKSGRYSVIVQIVTARSEQVRGARLKRAIAALAHNEEVQPLD